MYKIFLGEQDGSKFEHLLKPANRVHKQDLDTFLDALQNKIASLPQTSGPAELRNWLKARACTNEFEEWAIAFLILQMGNMIAPGNPLPKSHHEHWYDAQLTGPLLDRIFFQSTDLLLKRGEVKSTASAQRMEDTGQKSSNAMKADALVELFPPPRERTELLFIESKKQDTTKKSQQVDEVKIHIEMKDSYDFIRRNYNSKIRTLEDKQKIAVFGYLNVGFHLQILKLDLPFRRVYRVQTLADIELPRTTKHLEKYPQILRHVFDLYQEVLAVALHLTNLTSPPREASDEPSKDRPDDSNETSSKDSRKSDPRSRSSLGPTSSKPLKSSKSNTKSKNSQGKQRQDEIPNSLNGFRLPGILKFDSFIDFINCMLSIV